MHIIYRISDSGYKKNKPEYINNKNCLNNALEIFENCNWTIIADNTSKETDSYIPPEYIEKVSVGHGAGTFNLALDKALSLDDSEIVYFLENDYLHKPNSKMILEEGFGLNLSFVSLYDHPDKYISSDQKGANPFVKNNSELTRVFKTKSTHWKITNSTTMTFASKVSTLRALEKIFRKYTKETLPNDFHMFTHLRKLEHRIISPLPSFSTHGETKWLAHFYDWSKLCR
jgi:hypothetical protein